MDSPLTAIQPPTARSRSTLSGGISPEDVGPKTLRRSVPSFGSDVGEHLDHLRRRFEVLVNTVLPPVIVHGHARFPVEIRSFVGDELLRRAVVTQGSAVLIGFEAVRAAAAPDAAVDDDLGLEGADALFSRSLPRSLFQVPSHCPSNQRSPMGP